MKISYKWLIELTGLDWNPEDLGDRLTLCGTACEYIEAADQYMHGVVVGEILAINKIEGADKIRLATVNLGERQLDVVCGAPNIEDQIRVANDLIRGMEIYLSYRTEDDELELSMLKVYCNCCPTSTN